MSSRFRQKRATDPLESVRERLEGGQPYEAMQFVQSFLARKGDKLSTEEALGLACSTLELLLQRGEGACGADLVAWCVGRFALAAEHVRRVLDIASAGDSRANVAICRALLKTDFPELRPSIHARLGAAYAELEEYADANRWLLKSGDIAALADMLVAWAAHGHPSEMYMFGVRAVLNMLQAGKASEAEELRRLLSEKNHWDANVAPECRLCDMLFDLKAMDGRGVNQGEVLQVIRNHFEPKLIELDPRLGNVLEEIGYTCFGVPRPKKQPNLLGDLMNSIMGPGMAF